MSRVDFPNRLNKVRRQLNHILNDHRYYQSDSAREFTISMYTAFGKRKITKKMEISMDRIIANYTKWQSDNSKLDKYQMREKIENGIYKINLIRTLLSGAGYRPGYVGRSEEFLSSIENQIRLRGKLSIKQKKALNQMHKRFKANCEARGIYNVRVEEKLPPITK